MIPLLIGVGVSSTLLLYALGWWLFRPVSYSPPELGTVDRAGIPTRLYEDAKRRGFEV